MEPYRRKRYWFPDFSKPEDYKITKNQWLTLQRFWHGILPPTEEAVQAFFLYTDKGIEPSLDSRDWNSVVAYADFWNLWMAHKYHSYTVKSQVDDFKSGYLFLKDFDDAQLGVQKDVLRNYIVNYSGYITTYARTIMDRWGITPKEIGV